MGINKIICGDCIEELKKLEDNSIDAIITDPPYGLEFMGKSWDSFKETGNFEGGGFSRGNPYSRNNGTPIFYNIDNNKFQEFTFNWAKECLRVLKPGGYLLSFGGTRTYHRMTCGIEDAGFEIRDCIMWLYGCLSEDSEILTDKGWKRYDEISDKDIVYSFNLKTGKIERSKIENIFIYNHSGNMINFKNDNTDQLLTPNHKVIMKKEFREQNNNVRKWFCPEEWSWEYANQIKNYGKYNLPLGAVYEGYLSCGVDFASLLGWILSEGNFQKDTEAINIYQSSVNKDKVDMIRDLLNRLNIKHSEYKRKRKWKERYYVEHQFYFSGDIVRNIKEWIPNKKPTFDLLNLKYEEKIALFNSLMMGDGSKKKNSKNYNTFYQNDLIFLEWFQILCHLIGKQGRINKKKMCVEVSNNPNTQFQARHLKNRIKKYNGIVWSIQTNNMSYMARRNGKIFITGNSGFPKSLNIGKQIDKIQGNEREVVGVSSNEKDFRDVGKKVKEEIGIDKLSFGTIENAERKDLEITKGNSEWEGWGTALKPAVEPIVVARKPLSEKNVALNVLKWGTGGINIDESRVEAQGKDLDKLNSEWDREWNTNYSDYADKVGGSAGFNMDKAKKENAGLTGRFPANLIHDNSEEVRECFPDTKSKGHFPSNNKNGNSIFNTNNLEQEEQWLDDSGNASRFFKSCEFTEQDFDYPPFFYCAKASKSERNFGLDDFEDKQKCPMSKESRIGECINASKGMERFETICKNNHPTVKPVRLMEYLVKLVSREGSVILDPFLGSGTTGIACAKLNRHFIGIEKEQDYVKIAQARIKPYLKQRKLI